MMFHSSIPDVKTNNKGRFGVGVSNRLARVHPTSTMKYKDWEIPVGVRASLMVMKVDTTLTNINRHLLE